MAKIPRTRGKIQRDAISEAYDAYQAGKATDMQKAIIDAYESMSKESSDTVKKTAFMRAGKKPEPKKESANKTEPNSKKDTPKEEPKKDKPEEASKEKIMSDATKDKSNKSEPNDDIREDMIKLATEFRDRSSRMRDENARFTADTRAALNRLYTKDEINMLAAALGISSTTLGAILGSAMADDKAERDEVLR